ncbi:MAG: protein rep [Bacilli bacterium]
MRKCSSHLVYTKYSDGSKKFKSMKSCKIRLCPVCTWRRSMKIHYQSRAIFEQLEKEHSGEYDVLMFTLTIPSCDGGQLSDQITLLLKSFDKLMHRNEFKRYNAKTKKRDDTFWGWYRGLEVTHDNNEYITPQMYYNKKRHDYYVRRNLKVGDKNPSYDTYHPHLHVLFVAPKSYLHKKEVSRGYITPEMLLKMWREVTGIDRITQIHIDEIKPSKKDYSNSDLEFSESGIVNAICETTKYTVKESEYIAPWDWVLSLRTIMVLDKALFRRRLVAWGGILKEYHKKLNLDDAVDGDLINVGESLPNAEPLPEELHAFWNVGYQQYFVGDWEYS